MNKKGQAAMEFLMTYGWVILVVLGAIAVLAGFGFLDFSEWENPDKYRDFATKKCSERNLDLFYFQKDSKKVRWLCKNITEAWDFEYNKTNLKEYLKNQTIETKDFTDLKPNQSIQDKS